MASTAREAPTHLADAKSVLPPAFEAPTDDNLGTTHDAPIEERDFSTLGRLNLVERIGLVLLAAILVAMAAALVAIVSLRPDQTVSTWVNQRYGWNFVLALICIAVLLAGEAVLIFAVLVHMRRTRTAQELLRESEERMTVAAEAAAVGLWRWDVARQSMWLTPHGRQMLDLPAGLSTFDAVTIESRLHPDDRARVVAALDEAVSHGFDTNQTYEIEYRIKTADLHTRWVRMRGRPRRDRDGAVHEVTGLLMDITDSQQMRVELEKQRLNLLHLSRISVLGELSGALAHELKQPLTAIMSNAQAAQRLLSHQSVDFDELRAAIMDIIKDDARAGKVISHLRALLKNEEGHREPLDLNVIVANALDLVQNDLTAHRVNLITRLSDARLPLLGDTIQLQQLLLNLFINATEAMSGEAGGTLLVITDATGDHYAHIAISDTGTGINPGFLATLFDPLVTTKPHGMGLGLSISRAIVESHGGKIWAANNAGRGATIHAIFPLLKETAEAA